ncbi:MAG: MBL fold metallo-hydrolase [Clostridiales bacterium]|nr:MBL fold metallo-hydrolase [Clostridiales bacterium]
MKVTVLSENKSRPGFLSEHGLSLYIETERHKILFDFGAGSNFLSNAEKLGIDLGKVDVAFLSHGHYDHGGGLLSFLDVNKIANIYMNELVFEPHYNGQNKYIGLDETLDGHPRFIKVRDDITIDPELSFVKIGRLVKSIDTHGQKVKRGKILEKEKYEHEMYLMIKEGYKTYLISGCTHKGLINLVHAFRFNAFVGGLHLMKYDPIWDEDLLLEAVKAMKDSCAEYYSCHCTGEEQFQFLKDELKDKVHDLICGQSITIE